MTELFSYPNLQSYSLSPLVPLFTIFCYVFLRELRGPAWAVGSYSSGPPARGIPQILILKNLANQRMKSAVCQMLPRTCSCVPFAVWAMLGPNLVTMIGQQGPRDSSLKRVLPGWQSDCRGKSAPFGMTTSINSFLLSEKKTVVTKGNLMPESLSVLRCKYFYFSLEHGREGRGRLVVTRQQGSHRWLLHTSSLLLPPPSLRLFGEWVSPYFLKKA